MKSGSPGSLRSPSVLLINLPWPDLTEPNLGLGILRAVLDEEGIQCHVLHLNLFLLEHLRAYSIFALANTFALNDFLFSGILDPTVSRKQQQWLRLKTENLLALKLIDYRQYGGLDGVVQQLLRFRQEVIPAWLIRWADRITSSDTTLIGLTCNFDQTVPSLALAHLVKQRSPDILTVLGGYAVRPPTGDAVLRAFSFIDVVCNGEGEPAITGLARASVGEISLHDVPNILYRESHKTINATAVAPLVAMNNIPIPNYDDFFADLKMLADVHKVEVKVNHLPVEVSRGCWWGQKKHCIFCGVHDKDLVYRSPDAERLLEVMDSLAGRYAIHSFRLSGYILPYQYFKTLLPELARRNRPYNISSEMKANVNKEQFALLDAAGFNDVQPGIESFSSDVLCKLNKGNSAIQNVYTLLLGKRYRIAVRYNFLYGLPNDEPEEVATMVRALPRLFHLDPPVTRIPIQITRYAPLQVTPERFSIPHAVYEPSYDLIFSSGFLDETGFDLNDFCYYFDRPFENSPRLSRLYAEIDEIVDTWKGEQARRKVSLWYKERNEGIEIFDSRSDPPIQTCLTPTGASIYRLTGAPISIETLRVRCHELMDDAEFDHSLEQLDQLGLIFQDCGKVIGLALPKDLDSHQLSKIEANRSRP
jgi:ribosomal peptide maturation radical SAM protein 1